MISNHFTKFVDCSLFKLVCFFSSCSAEHKRRYLEGKIGVKQYRMNHIDLLWTTLYPQKNTDRDFRISSFFLLKEEIHKLHNNRHNNRRNSDETHFRHYFLQFCLVPQKLFCEICTLYSSTTFTLLHLYGYGKSDILLR